MVALVLLLLPALYLACYLILVVPPGANRSPRGPEFWRYNCPGFRPSVLQLSTPGTRNVTAAELIDQDFGGEVDVVYEYRWGGRRAAWFFWPLEQFDRRIRSAGSQ